MKKTSKILVAGSFVMDLIVSTHRFPERGETVLGSGFKTAPGGKGANQAVQAALLGADVSMFGKVGRDDFGERMRTAVANAGVDVSQVLICEDKPSAVGNVQIETKEDGSTQNRIIVVPGANMEITVEEAERLKKTISQYDLVILQLEIPMEVNETIAAFAHEAGVPVMLNSAPAAPLSDDLLSTLTYLSPNETEAQMLTGIPVSNEESIRQSGEYFLNKGVKNVLFTLGSRGAALYNRDEFIIKPCCDYGPVVDPTAAGDSFIGAFSTAVCCGLSHKDALVFANHTAGITVSRMGALPSLPTLDEVKSFLAKDGVSIEGIS